MAFAKWLNGVLTWATGEAVTHTDLNDSIDGTTPPIGAIIFWAKTFTGVPQTLPVGWIECDGAAVSDSDSPLDGQSVPDLNGDNRFLRGGTTSGVTGGEDTSSFGKETVSNQSADVQVYNTGGTRTGRASTLDYG